MAELIQNLIAEAAARAPKQTALIYQKQSVRFSELDDLMRRAANLFLSLGLQKADRVAIFLEKRIENIVAMFAAAQAGGVFVPVNPLLKGEQVGHILKDCNVRVLVTSADRLKILAPILAECTDLQSIITVDDSASTQANVLSWQSGLKQAPSGTPHRVIDGDMAAILYT